MTVPAVDGVTPQALVVIQDRPVVHFSQWLADALRVCTESGRGLQIVTPVSSRLTTPLRLVLSGQNSRWVVRHEDPEMTTGRPMYYDGLTGTELEWDGAMWAVRQETQSPAYTTGGNQQNGVQLTVTVRARHSSGATLGLVAEQLCLALTGQPPGGWGTAEPATGLWRRDELTGLHRRRAPHATWLTVVGRGHKPAVATMLLSPVDGGTEEAVTLVVGYENPDIPPIGALPTLIGALALECSIVSVFAQLAPGRPDLTAEPFWAGNPAPVGIAVGAGQADPDKSVPGIRSQRLGDMRSPTIWYELGDGQSQDGWQRYQELMTHLQPG